MRSVGMFVLPFMLVAAAAAQEQPPSPREVLQLDVGADRVLASYGESERYLRRLAEVSDRVEVFELGPTLEGRPMIAAAVSSPANLSRLAEFRQGWARIADPRTATPGEIEALAATLPACALVTAGIHSTEVAGPQAALLFVHLLAAAEAGSALAQWLGRVVVLVVPSLNPDGQEAVVGWYRRWLGTPYEGCQPPFLYHRYAGHDNNRDFVYLTQPESRALNRFVYKEWHPQLFLDLHQMGPTGPRQFVPPFADPVAANVHPLVWWVTSHLGTLMSWRLGEEGKGGVVSGWVFDGNWIGGTRNTGWWKNVFGVLTETASAALATPIDVDDNELRAGGKGLANYRQQVNFPQPWRGGRWGLADAVSYQLTVMRSFLEFAATHGEQLMRNKATMASAAVARGAQAPIAYLVAPDGDDPGRSRTLVALLQEAGVETRAATAGVRADGVDYPPGTVVIPTAQPLRQYIVEVLERQSYPEVMPEGGGEILLPYDITAWSIPLAFGVEVVRVEHALAGDSVLLSQPPAWPDPPAQGSGAWAMCDAAQVGCYALVNRVRAEGGEVCRATLPRQHSERNAAPGSFFVGGIAAERLVPLARREGVRLRLTEAPPAGCRAVRPQTTAVYHPAFGFEDAGWVRFVLEQAGFPTTVAHNGDIAAKGLFDRAKVLVFPPLEGKVIVDGTSRPNAVPMPPDHRGGIGSAGLAEVARFFDAGGTVIGFGPSAEWLAEALSLPVTNPLHGAARDEFYAPGAQLSLAVEEDLPLTWGVAARIAVMVDGACGFQTRPAAGETLRTVAARFPDEPLVLSGWLRGEERLRRRAAVVEVRRGAGRAVLFAFAPYFRGQTRAAFPLLFNAVLGAGVKDDHRP